MASFADHHAAHRRRHHRKRAAASPLAAPVMLLAAACIIAIVYVSYVLWPRWPDAAVSVDAPSVPINVAGTVFNVEPAAIRVPIQRRAGAQTRIDIGYLWPSLLPPDPSVKVIDGAPVDPNERLFALVQAEDGAMPLPERVRNIYPRYLAKAPVAGPEGLTVRPFADGTPYQGEDLLQDAAAPESFVARCSRKGVTNSGTCLVERRIGNADVTFRFPREWLSDWKSVAAGIDKLIARWQP